jgi:hypothetical protein
LSKITNIEPACLFIARENHQDGGEHFHCYFDTEETHIINTPDHFDFEGVHPRIDKIRKTPYKVFAYVTKDGRIEFEHGEPPEAPTKPIKPSQNEIWRKCIEEATDKDSFIALIQEHCTRDCVLHFRSIELFADYRWRAKREAYVAEPLTIDYEAYPALENWVNRYITNQAPTQMRPKSLILWGESQLGKTIWARSLGNHAYFGGMFMLDLLDDLTGESRFAIFDDLANGFKNFPFYKQWMGGQKEFVTTDKYRSKKRISWGRPSIYICNTDPREDKDVDWDWMDKNVILQQITTPLARFVEPSLLPEDELFVV